jgi:hypothetical protein
MSNSHLGQPVGNHVTLSGYSTTQGDSSAWAFFRIFPDGKGDSFKLLKGKALVVTDVDWNYSGGEHNRTQIFNIFMKVPGKETREAIFASTVLADAAGSGGESVSMTNGFVVTKMESLEPNLAFGGELNDFILRGYLIDIPLKRRPH